MPGAPAWTLPAAQDGECLSGGHRSLHELAVAIAVTGRHVEVRGQFDFRELRALTEAAGGGPELPTEPRVPQPGDVVLMAEGFIDPLTFGTVALSPARAILFLLAPTGLFGWGFVADWAWEHPHEVALERVARAEHHRAMAAMGFELWTETAPLAKRVEATGVSCTWVGTGRPIPYPPPLPKRYDVVTLAHNRWAELARFVVSSLDNGVTHREIPPAPYEDVLRELGQAHILIHPMRIEGLSRIGQEARAMGAVPVVLDTNPYRVGLDEDGGAVAVSSLDKMAGAVMGLLGDQDRLADLRERGMKAVRQQVDWGRFVERVDAALARPAPDDPARGARASVGARLAEIETALRTDLDKTRKALSVTCADRDNLAEALEHERRRLETMQSTRIWQLAQRYWRARDAVVRMVRRR